MKHSTRLRLLLSVVALTILNLSVSAQNLKLTEVLFAPGGNDSPYEFIEIKGTPSTLIPANTYVLFVEGDPGGSTGKTKMIFDFGGLTTGSNGYVAFVLAGHPYTLTPGATIVTGETPANTGWEQHSRYRGSSSDKLIEDASMSILLVTAAAAHTNTSFDLDTNDDGALDLPEGWVLHDAVGALDNDYASESAGTAEAGYGQLIYSQAGAANTKYAEGASVIEIDFKPGYISRIGESTGSTGDDWFSASTASSPAGEINSTSSDKAFSGEIITEVGGPSWVYTPASYTGSEDLTAVDKTQDLTISANVSSADDLECHNLTIDEGSTFTLTDAGSMKVYGSLTVNGSLVVGNGGTLWTFEGKSAGAAVFQRETTYDDTRYSMVGSPVEADESITGSDLGSVSFYYDETEDYGDNDGLARWKNASSMMLQPGVGYAQAKQEVISVTGVPNVGTISVPVTHTVAAAADAGNRGFNLVSNPYGSAITGADFFSANTNISGSIYLWDDGGTTDEVRRTNADYIIANNAGYVSGGSDRILNGETPRYEGDIRSFQGFFVQVPDNNGGDNSTNVVFRESMRQTGNNNDVRFFRTEKEVFPTLTLGIKTADGLYNETVVSLLSDATMGWDRMYDAITPQGKSTLQIYSLLDGENYAIQGLPIEDGVATELGFDLGADAMLTLAVKELNGLENGMTFLLHDRVTDKVYDLSEIKSIDFSAKSGTDQNRFFLTYTSRSVLKANLIQNQPIYKFNDGALNVDFGKTLDINAYAVYDLSGKILHQSNAIQTNKKDVVIPITNKGFNVVKIITSEGSFTRKFLF